MNDQGKNPVVIEAELKQVDWSKDPNLDRAAILQRANSNKHQEIWHNELRRQEKEADAKAKEATKAIWTATGFYVYMRKTAREVYGKTLIDNEQTRPLIKTICLFLSGDPRFETELGHSFTKGLMLRGPSGLGKTDLVKWVSDNELNPVNIISMIRIAETVKNDGEFTIGSTRTLYLDDVGSEMAPVKHYGTEINWLKDFIELYYTTSKPFHKLMISTNLTGDDLEKKYGYRVRSRLREMFNVIDVQGEDLRG